VFITLWVLKKLPDWQEKKMNKSPRSSGIKKTWHIQIAHWKLCFAGSWHCLSNPTLSAYQESVLLVREDGRPNWMRKWKVEIIDTNAEKWRHSVHLGLISTCRLSSSIRFRLWSLATVTLPNIQHEALGCKLPFLIPSHSEILRRDCVHSTTPKQGKLLKTSNSSSKL
jgi:hypothetical protein